MAVLAALAGPAMLAGCSGPRVEAAPEATSAVCTAALQAAPERVLDGSRTTLDTPGALAWGDPAIVLRCGVPEPGPGTLRCLGVNGVDWVIDDTVDPVTAVSYGRSPAVEVSTARSGDLSRLPAALVDLAPVARAMPRTARSCTGSS